MLAIRKVPGPVEVAVGEAVFLVRRVSFADQQAIRARVRKAGGGTVGEDEFTREVCRHALVGWRGLRFEDTGEEALWPACPLCGGTVSPKPDPASCTPVPPPCEGCGGTGAAVDWAMGAFPQAIWQQILDEAYRVVSREEGLLKN